MLLSWFLNAVIDDDRTKAVFNQFDRDGSGYLTQENILKALGVMGKHIAQAEIDDLMARYGSADGRGLDFENFKQFLLYG